MGPASKFQPKNGDGGSSLPGDISRRTSSCTSQISGDDRRQLYRYTKFAYESRDYGSMLSQIREANMEATSGWDFTNKFFNIVCKSGIKYLHECPLQTNIPIYFLIGGFCGLVDLVWATYSQIQSRKYEHCDSSFFEEDALLGSNTLRLMQWALRGFLFFWFALGNSWILGLSGPNGPPPFSHSLQAQNPTAWCSEQLYLYSLAHLYIVYGLAAVFVLMWVACFTISTIRNYQQSK
ncbi:unnamed protein product [Allacma fusca]|uniref:Transmembrane protein n=1 Tax=Allacma fusca TaxID=39272 RepID=A0A8J2P0G6_9HEXA|nr:unnamed protein product [Allacma fusca]